MPSKADVFYCSIARHGRSIYPLLRLNLSKRASYLVRGQANGVDHEQAGCDALHKYSELITVM